MRYPSLTFFNKLKFAGFPSERLADYAYALVFCQYPASVVDGEWHQKVDCLCRLKMEELRDEINRRLKESGDKAVLTHAMDVLEDKKDIHAGKLPYSFPTKSEFSRLSASELIRLHSLGKHWHDLREKKGVEPFTRLCQWQIVYELMSRKEENLLARIVMLIEFLEADGYALTLYLPYQIGDKFESFNPSAYPSDAALIDNIKKLGQSRTYISREALIEIADYIQTEIVESGKTTEYLQLVNEILSANIPSFNYPRMVSEFEKATKSLAKSNALSQIELAPSYLTLWSLTMKPTYLSRFEKTVRHCYFTLAKDRIFPGLGIDLNDSRSLTSALEFLDANRQTLWVLNERYDVDKVISKYTAV